VLHNFTKAEQDAVDESIDQGVLKLAQHIGGRVGVTAVRIFGSQTTQSTRKGADKVSKSNHELRNRDTGVKTVVEETVKHTRAGRGKQVGDKVIKSTDGLQEGSASRETRSKDTKAEDEKHASRGLDERG